MLRSVGSARNGAATQKNRNRACTALDVRDSRYQPTIDEPAQQALGSELAALVAVTQVQHLCEVKVHQTVVLAQVERINARCPASPRFSALRFQRQAVVKP
jgi:hypothetical protein